MLPVVWEMKMDIPGKKLRAVSEITVNPPRPVTSARTLT
jgi:hypothetical protein